MRITVAICTWNRCELLRQTLHRLTEIRVPAGLSWELIVVNNNCSDRTNDVATAYMAALPLRLVFEPQPGLSNARNRSIAEARGDYIAWIDDDVLVSGDWLAALAEAADRFPEAHAFGGPIEPWFPVPPDPELAAAFPAVANGFCGLDYGQTEMPLRPGKPIYGANMVFAREAIQGLRFNPALGTREGSGGSDEDVEFLAQVTSRGGAVVWVPRLRVKHYVDPKRMTLAYLRRFYYDRGRTAIQRGGSDDMPRLLGAPRWCWRSLVLHFMRYMVLRGTPMRRQALVSFREYHYVRGQLAESRAQHRSASLTRATGTAGLESGA
jgi:glycosyltransferase involved in cell wall biosynthesis